MPHERDEEAAREAAILKAKLEAEHARERNVTQRRTRWLVRVLEAILDVFVGLAP